MASEVNFCLQTLQTATETYTYYSLPALEKNGFGRISKLPYALRYVLAATLRHCDSKKTGLEDIKRLATWEPRGKRDVVSLYANRVLLQDFTGVPVLVDLAAMRSALARKGGDPAQINPKVPVDLVIDHSVQVEFFGTPGAFKQNLKAEMESNRERFQFLRWAQKSFDHLRLVPPGHGIVHQINVELLSDVVMVNSAFGAPLAYPDFVLGSDSHTPMINSLGVPGWGVGGIETLAAILGEPVDFKLPDVIGVCLSGGLIDGITAMDAALSLTEVLRKRGVVNTFIEFFGDGVNRLSLPERAIIANMTPEYGATISFFPVDFITMDYLCLTNRNPGQIDLIERFCKAQGLFRTSGAPIPEYSDVIDFDLAKVEPCLAGPRRPYERQTLKQVKNSYIGSGQFKKDPSGIISGAVLLAAIDSCTNTASPEAMIGAGLVARRAVEKGLQPPAYVKASITAGSQAVVDYLKKADFLEDFEAIGFHVAALGCATCIGNSGRLTDDVEALTENEKQNGVSVTSGNRNFENRIHPALQSNYLASPPLVVAYALAGRIDIDFETEPVGYDSMNNPVFLKDLWFTSLEVKKITRELINPELYQKAYKNLFKGEKEWDQLGVSDQKVYSWNADSTYIQEPPYFLNGFAKNKLEDIYNARPLAVFGDSITTDHISPAGRIASDSPAGKYLQSLGVKAEEFNSYGTRRGNDRVMTRGTFAHPRLKNALLPDQEGWNTLYFPDSSTLSIDEAARKYRQSGVPLILLAGKEYGIGSSRDWAAKGTALLGVKAVLAESYERIHRSNLAGMGVLPLRYLEGQSAQSLGISGKEAFSICGMKDLKPYGRLQVMAESENGTIQFEVEVCLNSIREVETYSRGGILNSVMANIL